MAGYLGEVRDFAGNFCPTGWRYTDGSLININDNYTLYALLGTVYGGDGVTTFGLPTMQREVSSNTYGLLCQDFTGPQCVSTCICTDLSVCDFPSRQDATPWQSFQREYRSPYTLFVVATVLVMLLLWSLLQCAFGAIYKKCMARIRKNWSSKQYHKKVDFAASDSEQEEEQENLNAIDDNA